MENYSYANYVAEEKDGKKKTDASKNKRSSRKKPASKLTKAPTEDSDVMIIPDAIPDLDLNLAEYACKLQFELLYTRKKLKKQRKMFESLMKSLTLSFDCQDIHPQLITEYVESVSRQLGDDSDDDEYKEEEEEAILGKEPYKRDAIEESETHVNLVGTAEGTNLKSHDKISTKGASTSKQPTNVIKINLSDPDIQQQEPPLSKARGSKKSSKAEKLEILTIDQPPKSPKQKRKAAAKKEKKKEADSAPLLKEAQETTANETKPGKASRKSGNPKEQSQPIHQQFQQSPVKNQIGLQAKPEDMMRSGFGMTIPNNMISNMLNSGDVYNYNMMFNGINAKELEKLYQNFLPSNFGK